MADKRYAQGLYTPRNPHKYVGDLTKIRYMSSYELNTHKFLDNNERVLRWSSEPIAIPYLKPTDGRVHKYLPDYWVEFITADGEIVQEILEVKPMDQVRKPRAGRKHALYEQVTYAINQAKWAAAIRFCEANNMRFRVITERSIFK